MLYSLLMFLVSIRLNVKGLLYIKLICEAFEVSIMIYCKTLEVDNSYDLYAIILCI